MMLLSIALLFFISGNTEFSAIQAALKNSPHNFIVIFAISMFICALFIKGGLVPFHGWLPEVYASAPAPVSILLAGVVTKILGVFILIRMAISVIGFSHSMNQVFLFVGALSIVVGALAALGQSDFKRMLAYSSISQVGYILAGIGSGSALGILGAVFHLFNHSVFKSTLFVNSAALESQTGTRNINKMSGLASKMPITAATSVISSLSTAGLPPLAGFWSKLLIVLALWLSGNYVYALVAIIASIITLAYFILMLRKVFFGNNVAEESANVKEAGFSLLFPACLLSGINIGLGLAFPLLLKLLNFR
jgi:multicomponent Na+:H+ antiporter subunit D